MSSYTRHSFQAAGLLPQVRGLLAATCQTALNRSEKVGKRNSVA